MADQQKSHKAEEAAELTPGQIAMMKVLIEEMRKPYVDPDVVARNERARQRLREQRAEDEANVEARWNQCSHMREDNTSRVAWIENFHRAISRYVIEGFCQQCNKPFRPGVAGYEAMLRIPVGKNGIVS
jgi:hypothetical protein